MGRNREIVGATVLVHPTDEPSRLFVTASDSKGRFRIDNLPDGTYRVEVRREGLETVIKDSVGLKFPARAVIEVTMERAEATDRPGPAAAGEGSAPTPVNLRGEVVQPGGESVSDVELRFVRPDGFVDPFTLRSAADGTFDLGRVPTGPWRLEAHLVGFLPIWIAMDIQRDTTLVVSMVRQPAGYAPSPLELMPREQPILPERWRIEPIGP